MGDPDVLERVRRVESTLEALENLPSPHRELAVDAVQAILDLYGVGWRRLLERLERADAPLRPMALAEDELVGHLLMVHGLHPLGVTGPEELPGGPGGPPLVKLESARADKASP